MLPRMETLLKNCDRDLKSWIYRIDNTFPHGNSKIRQRWKKIIVAVDKPKLVDLVSKVSVYTSQIDGMLGIMRGYVYPGLLGYLLTTNQRSWSIHKCYCGGHVVECWKVQLQT